MSTHVLRDRNGHKLGTIDADGNGVQTIRDANGHRKGTYDPKADKTRDHNGHVVGLGNLLSALL